MTYFELILCGEDGVNGAVNQLFSKSIKFPAFNQIFQNALTQMNKSKVYG